MSNSVFGQLQANPGMGALQPPLPPPSPPAALPPALPPALPAAGAVGESLRNTHVRCRVPPAPAGSLVSRRGVTPLALLAVTDAVRCRRRPPPARRRRRSNPRSVIPFCFLFQARYIS